LNNNLRSIHPEYINTSNQKLLQLKEELFNNLSCCTLCPNNCKVNRLSGKVGKCKAPIKTTIASYSVHNGEEPPISGTKGSGTIFFSFCTLSCIYCQNYPISQLHNGNEVNDKELAEIMIKLQEKGCHNINLVTPTQFLPFILSSIIIAKEMGLKIPIVYNSSGWENVDIVKIIKYFIDVYLPDSRYINDDIAIEFSKAYDYSEINKYALLEMKKNQPKNIFDKDGNILKGLIIRVLILPHYAEDVVEILKNIKDKLGVDTYISLMSQYHPCYKALDDNKLNRKITEEEHENVQSSLIKLGFKNGWTQDYE